jgi:hypothetical protein
MLMNNAAEVKELKGKLKAKSLQLARAQQTIKNQRAEIRALREKLPEVPPDIVDGSDDGSPDDSDVIYDRHTIKEELLRELLDHDTTNPKARRYSKNLCLFAFALQTISARAYRFIRTILAFPSRNTVVAHMASRKALLRQAIDNSNIHAIMAHLRRYRITERIDPKQPISCTLAFDAASVTASGIPGKDRKNRSRFAFLLLPLDHRRPDLLLQSVSHPTGRMDKTILLKKEQICNCLSHSNFLCHFIATDGDSGMNRSHTEAFALYKETNGNLAVILPILTNNYTQPLLFHVTPDSFHLLKNARARAALGRLAFNGASVIVITGEILTKELTKDLVGVTFTASSPLDLLKDDLALAAFTIDNLLALWECGDVAGSYFIFPFVCMSSAIRDPRLSVQTCLELIQAFFTAFFTMLRDYPATGAEAGISEITTKSCSKKTFWTKCMCERGCNLGASLYYAVERWGDSEEFWLALNRISSHPCECHFGMTRSTLKNDPREDRFLSAEVDAALIHDIMRELDLPPYIRRFKTEGGCTLGPPSSDLVYVPFGDIIAQITQLFQQLKTTPRLSHLPMSHPFITPFVALNAALRDQNGVVQIKKSGVMAGGAIRTRFFMLPHGKAEPTKEQREHYEVLADE